MAGDRLVSVSDHESNRILLLFSCLSNSLPFHDMQPSLINIQPLSNHQVLHSLISQHNFIDVSQLVLHYVHRYNYHLTHDR